MIIAIDGPAASGKGTIGRRIAKHFGMQYLDTGKLYRAVGYNLLNEIVKLQYKTQCGQIIYIDDQLSDLQMASIYKNSKTLLLYASMLLVQLT